jgi:hypothetical protein
MKLNRRILFLASLVAAFALFAASTSAQTLVQSAAHSHGPRARPS